MVLGPRQASHMPRRAAPGESRLPTGRKAAGPGQGGTEDKHRAGRAAGGVPYSGAGPQLIGVWSHLGHEQPDLRSSHSVLQVSQALSREAPNVWVGGPDRWLMERRCMVFSGLPQESVILRLICDFKSATQRIPLSCRHLREPECRPGAPRQVVYLPWLPPSYLSNGLNFCVSPNSHVEAPNLPCHGTRSSFGR